MMTTARMMQQGLRLLLDRAGRVAEVVVVRDRGVMAADRAGLVAPVGRVAVGVAGEMGVMGVVVAGRAVRVVDPAAVVEAVVGVGPVVRLVVDLVVDKVRGVRM